MVGCTMSLLERYTDGTYDFAGVLWAGGVFCLTAEVGPNLGERVAASAAAFLLALIQTRKLWTDQADREELRESIFLFFLKCVVYGLPIAFTNIFVVGGTPIVWGFLFLHLLAWGCLAIVARQGVCFERVK